MSDLTNYVNGKSLNSTVGGLTEWLAADFDNGDGWIAQLQNYSNSSDSAKKETTRVFLKGIRDAF
jgi:hypothetical protein